MADEIVSEVRTLRFTHGEMTQEDLASRVGVTRQTIVAIERGNYNPSVGLGLRIARVFGVPVEQVFRLADEAGPRTSASASARGAGTTRRSGR